MFSRDDEDAPYAKVIEHVIKPLLIDDLSARKNNHDADFGIIIPSPYELERKRMKSYEEWQEIRREEMAAGSAYDSAQRCEMQGNIFMANQLNAAGDYHRRHADELWNIYNSDDERDK